MMERLLHDAAQTAAQGVARHIIMKVIEPKLPRSSPELLAQQTLQRLDAQIAQLQSLHMNAGASLAKEEPHLERPGCTAADESLLVYEHLMRLSKGWGGFGVLRTSTERMTRAVQGAKGMGDETVASKLEAINKKLPEVRTPEAASLLAQELEPVLSETWALGQRCGAYHLPPAILKKAIALSDQVHKGTIQRDAAVAVLRQDLEAEAALAPPLESQGADPKPS